MCVPVRGNGWQTHAMQGHQPDEYDQYRKYATQNKEGPESVAEKHRGLRVFYPGCQGRELIT